jgi:DNA replication protein
MPDPGQSDDATTGIPTRFLESVAPQIHDIAELQVMLSFFRLAADPPEYGEPLHEELLFQDSAVNRALRMAGAAQPPRDAIRHGIELAVARDTLLRFRVQAPDQPDEAWLLYATQQNRLRLERYRKGTLAPPGVPDPPPGTQVRVERPNVFLLYEQNIGLVTPIIADQLIEAMEMYPRVWIEDAIAEAVGYNRRNWRYVQRILQNWATEGRGNETGQRHQRAPGTFDPDRHLRGEHAALFRRRR